MEKILLIEDDTQVCDLISRILCEASGYELLQATTGGEGLQKAHENPGIQVVICDIHLPDISGMAVISQLLTQYPHLLIIPCSGAPIEWDMADSRILDRLPKPFGLESLRGTVAAAVYQQRRRHTSTHV